MVFDGLIDVHIFNGVLVFGLDSLYFFVSCYLVCKFVFLMVFGGLMEFLELSTLWHSLIVLCQKKWDGQ